MILLSNDQTLKLLRKLIFEPQPVKKGLTGQYFIAHQILKDLDAKVSHGKRKIADIGLSSIGSKILEKFISKLNVENIQTLEVKTFRWKYTNFRDAIRSYKNRKQKDFFVGLSITLQVSNSEDLTFNSKIVGILIGVVIFMETKTTKIPSKQLWKDINKLIQEKLPDNEVLDDVDVDNLLTVMNYQEGIETQEQVNEINLKLEKIQKQMEEDKEQAEEDRKQIGNIQNDLKSLLKLLKKK